MKQMKSLLFFFKKYTIMLIFLVLFTVCSLTVDRFFTPSNLMNVLLQSSILGTMAVGITLIVINGHRDMSIGMIMGLSAALTVGLQPQLGWASILVGLAAGAAIGLVNGLLVGKVGINHFIVTLATMQGTRCLTYLYMQEQPIPSTMPGFAEFGSGKFLGIYNLVWIFLIMIVLGEFILRKTKHGRNTYAVGGNREAAANAGINVQHTIIINFMLSGLFGALGGIMNAARINSAIPELGYPNTHFLVMTMVVLGGTKQAGGYGNMLLTVGGALIIGIVQNVMNLLNIHTYYSLLVTGLILIAVLYMDNRMKPVAQK